MGLLFIHSLVFYLVSLRAKLLLEISKLPLKPTVKQQVKVASMRSHLAKQEDPVDYSLDEDISSVRRFGPVRSFDP